jgi:outer membrane protein
MKRLFANSAALALLTLLVAPPAVAELSNTTIVGPGIRLRPAYDGSAAHHIELVPIVRYLGQPWFLRSTQGVLEGGARFELAPGLHAGVQLAYEPGRNASESAFLKNHNVDDIDSGASVGAHLEWDHKLGPVPITLLVRARQDANTDHGAQADLRLSVGVFQRGPLAVGAFTQATWANAKGTRTLYGVDPQQSAATHLPAYAAGSGLLFASAGLLYSIDLGSKWAVVGNFEARHLQGDARNSPLVERSMNYYATVGAVYRF